LGILRTSHKVRSAKFAFNEFSEVRMQDRA
jgi:hypothetical protein